MRRSQVFITDLALRCLPIIILDTAVPGEKRLQNFMLIKTGFSDPGTVSSDFPFFYHYELLVINY